MPAASTLPRVGCPTGRVGTPAFESLPRVASARLDGDGRTLRLCFAAPLHNAEIPRDTQAFTQSRDGGAVFSAATTAERPAREHTAPDRLVLVLAFAVRAGEGHDHRLRLHTAGAPEEWPLS